MIKYALTYGLIAGLIVISTMITGMVLSGGEGAGSSQWLGYLIMLVALTLIFIGVRRFRDRELGGVINFGRAFGLGLMIAAIAGVAYVLVWEIYLAATDHAFIDNYVNALLEKKEAAGLSAEKLAEEAAKMDELKAQYANPMFRIPITFSEIFPVGVVVALITAFVVRTRGR